MQLVSLYPFDPTGRASANRIENQSITVTPPTQITDYSYVVPRGAPFYADSLVVKDGRNVGARTLVENVDYWCVIDFLSASVSLTKRVCVGIALLDPGYSGTLYITYQAVGGNYSLADYSVLEELIRERYVVKHVSYEQIINLPEGFAPEWHRHEIADMVGMGQVVTTLNNIKIAIDGRQGSYGQLSAQISNHTGSSAAHTPSQVGLSNVKNYDVATLAEVNTGAANKYVTAAVMKQYVSGQGQDVSAFITASTANATFATKAQLNSYSTTSQSDSKYALKSDSYTKAQVNALIEGIDVSSSLSGFYTKSQSDAKYALKTDISGYIKESVADGRYATKASMTSYSTTSQADGKYATKTASYTKSESDSRYLLPATLTSYITASAADSKYLQSSALNNYYTKAESNANYPTKSQFNTLVNTTLPQAIFDFKNIRFERNPSTKEPQLRLEYNQDNKTVAYFAPLSFLDDVEAKKDKNKIYTRQFNKSITYRSYTLSTTWKLRYAPHTGLLHINIFVNTPFYFHENIVINLNSGPAPHSNGKSTPATLTYYGYESGPTSLNRNNDAWYMRRENAAALPISGEINIPISFSAPNGQEYVNGMGTTVILGVENSMEHACVMQWFTESNAYIP